MIHTYGRSWKFWSAEDRLNYSISLSKWKYKQTYSFNFRSLSDIEIQWILEKKNNVKFLLKRNKQKTFLIVPGINRWDGLRNIDSYCCLREEISQYPNVTWGFSGVRSWPSHSTVRLHGRSNKPMSYHGWLRPRKVLFAGRTVELCRLTVLWSGRRVSRYSKLPCPVNHCRRLQKKKIL